MANHYDYDTYYCKCGKNTFESYLESTRDFQRELDCCVKPKSLAEELSVAPPKTEGEFIKPRFKVVNEDKNNYIVEVYQHKEPWTLLIPKNMEGYEKFAIGLNLVTGGHYE